MNGHGLRRAICCGSGADVKSENPKVRIMASWGTCTYAGNLLFCRGVGGWGTRDLGQAAKAAGCCKGLVACLGKESLGGLRLLLAHRGWVISLVQGCGVLGVCVGRRCLEMCRAKY